MKQHFIMLCFLVVIGLVFGVAGCQPDPDSPEGILKDVDAKRAIAIANEWKWSKKDIKSRVTGREVVFELSEGNVKRIPLPDDAMMVAVAPYIDKTHQ